MNMTLSPEKLLELVVKAADKRQAENILAFDVRGLSILADYFVVLNGSSNRQNRAIANSIVEDAAEKGARIKGVEGKEGSGWTLIDLSDVIVHVFSKEDREVYNIEKLWSDADLVDISDYLIEEA